MAALESLEEAERQYASLKDGKPRVRDLETYAALLLWAGLESRRQAFEAETAKGRLIQPATMKDVAAVAKR